MRSDYDKNDFFEDFPELIESDVDWNKEVLAHFGLLFSAFALLETSIQNCFVFAEMTKLLKQGEVKTEDAWQRNFDALEKKAFSATLGTLLRYVAGYEEFEPIIDELQYLKRSRDYFAHHFFREENDHMHSDEKIFALVLQINKVRVRLKKSEVETDKIHRGYFQTLYPKLDVNDMLERQVLVLKEKASSDPRKSFGWEDLE